MIRLFERHRKRCTYCLDGIWKFKTDPAGRGEKEEWYKHFPGDAVDIVVPSCWNNELGLYEYEGKAWYAKKFRTRSENINILFHGVTGQAEVYLDGNHLGGHYGGFTGFNFVVENLPAGEHSLVVCVDNTHSDIDTIPLARVDWYHYGGITRSVEIMELGDLWIKDCRIDYRLDEKLENALLDFEVTVQSFSKNTGAGHNAGPAYLDIYINERKFHTVEFKAEKESVIKVEGLPLEGVKLWNPGEPNLYMVRFETGNDDLTERIGFRKIEIKNKKLYINNREVRLKGVNRHEDHPDWGFALPYKLMKKDMDIIKNLGCNTIRGSHYPNAEIFLDLCDQEGILFWEEIPMWGFREESLKNPLVLERGLKMHEEMVRRDYHHPCIFVWGLHNEIDTRIPAAYEITRAFADKIRSIDKTRPLTYASMYPLDDICFSLVDIVSINKYFGWYDGNIEKWVDCIAALKEKLQNENLSHMPIIISEFGAGGIYGENTFEGPKWTENYQDKYLDYTIRLFSNVPDIIGMYVWQYCDIRTAREMALERPRSFNNKGLVNEYRKPKQAYWTVKKLYEEL